MCSTPETRSRGSRWAATTTIASCVRTTPRPGHALTLVRSMAASSTAEIVRHTVGCDATEPNRSDRDCVQGEDLFERSVGLGYEAGRVGTEPVAGALETGHADVGGQAGDPFVGTSVLQQHGQPLR